jgi:arabinogalactan oligomer/maltooligosaccharide transport system substrate-binding protein
MIGRGRRRLALVATLAVLAAGCGGGDGGSDSGASDVEGVPEAGDTAVVERADADLVVWADEARAETLEPLVSGFAAELGVTAAVQAVPAQDLQDAFVVANTEGTGPDVVAGEHAWIGTMVRNGAINRLGLSDVDRGRYSSLSLSGVTYDGRLYGLPYAVQSLVLYRNTDLVPTVPTTIEELVETGASSDAQDPLCLPVGPTGDAFYLQPLYSSAGGYIFGTTSQDEPDPSDLGVGGPGSVAFATKLGELGAAGVLTTSTTPENALDRFVESGCAYLVAGPEAAPALRTAGVPYAVSPVPGFADAGTAQPFVEVQAFFLASKGRSQDLARQLVLDGINSPEAMQALYDAGQGVPAMTEVLEAAAEQSPEVARFAEAADAGTILPAIPQMASVWGPLGQAEAAVVRGADPADTMQDAGAEIARSLQ